MTTKTKKTSKPRKLTVKAAGRVRGGVKSGVRAGLLDGNFKAPACDGASKDPAYMT